MSTVVQEYEGLRRGKDGFIMQTTGPHLTTTVLSETGSSQEHALDGDCHLLVIIPDVDIWYKFGATPVTVVAAAADAQKALANERLAISVDPVTETHMAYITA